MSTRVIRPLIRSDAANASLGVASAGKIIQADAAGHADASFIRATKSIFASSVSGFNPTTIETAINALASVRPLAIGSNANGTFWRTEEGFQICWSTALSLVFLSEFVLQVTWTYPAQFTSNPFVRPVIRALSATGFGLSSIATDVAATTGNSTSVLQLVCTAGTTNRFASGDTATIQALAIGRWK